MLLLKAIFSCERAWVNALMRGPTREIALDREFRPRLAGLVRSRVGLGEVECRVVRY